MKRKRSFRRNGKKIRAIYAGALTAGITAYVGLGQSIGLFDVKEITHTAIVKLSNPEHRVEIVFDEDNVDYESFMESFELVKRQFRKQAGIELVLAGKRSEKLEDTPYIEYEHAPEHRLPNTTVVAVTDKDYQDKDKSTGHVFNYVGRSWSHRDYSSGRKRSLRKIVLDTINQRSVHENARLLQHELTHIFGIENRYVDASNSDIMNSPGKWGDIWSAEDIQTIREECRQYELTSRY